MGEGDVTVVFIHGNLASKDWISLAAPLFPVGLRVIGIDWRGCGDSDRPAPLPVKFGLEASLFWTKRSRKPSTKAMLTCCAGLAASIQAMRDRADRDIAQELTDRGIKTPGGGDV